MSGHGAPDFSNDQFDETITAGLRLGIVASQWHTVVMDALIAGALRAAERAGITDARVVRVPGSYELPLAAQALAPTCDALVALGVVIRGGTPHFEYVCQAATNGLMSVGLESSIPIGFGLLTCDNDAQALDRAGLEGSSEDKGAEAAEAAIRMALLTRSLRVAGA